ncbi:MAG: hypothetical protein HQ515_04165 [Phycisphaeraceae bacterium]|nr:hypothetical protein [Phycisphaeraceae bacterium]
MQQETQCDNCGHMVVPLPDSSCPVCDRLIILPDDQGESETDASGGPTPLHFVARHADDQSKLTWGSRAPYALIVLINLISFQFEGLGERTFTVSFVAVLMSIYCTRVFYRVLSELAANWSPGNPFWEGFLRTTMALSLSVVIAALGYAVFM